MKSGANFCGGAVERTRTSAKSLIFFAAILTTLPESERSPAIGGDDSNIARTGSETAQLGLRIAARTGS